MIKWAVLFNACSLCKIHTSPVASQNKKNKESKMLCDKCFNNISYYDFSSLLLFSCRKSRLRMQLEALFRST
jgi:hypothetical protein